MPSDEKSARADSEVLKRMGFEAGEPVLELSVGFTSNALLGALKSVGPYGSEPLPIQGVDQPATLNVHILSVTKVFEPRIVKSGSADVDESLGTLDDPSWKFYGWMVELYPEPQVIHVRGYLSDDTCLVQRVPRTPDPDGHVTRIGEN